MEYESKKAGRNEKRSWYCRLNDGFYCARLFGNWRIILDGTGLYYFKEKHCENCLVTTRKTEDGKEVKMYYHKVLEAKLVLADNVVISIDTEFIENENENGTGQYANHVEVGAGKTETANIFEYEYEYMEKKQIKKSKIMWVTC